MAQLPSENAQLEDAKGHAVRLAATTPTLVWATKEMEGRCEKEP